MVNAVEILAMIHVYKLSVFNNLYELMPQDYLTSLDIKSLSDKLS
jgi:hypothetical protein